jgi:hypothetical protein
MWDFPQDEFARNGGVNWLLVVLCRLFAQLGRRDSDNKFLFACVTRNRGFLMFVRLS